MDAAIAATTYKLVTAATLGDGYGSPSTMTLAGEQLVGMDAKKYGAASRLTRGKVSAINAGYSINGDMADIVVDGADFQIPGDSGALLVSDSGNNPIYIPLQNGPLLIAQNHESDFTVF